MLAAAVLGRQKGWYWRTYKGDFISSTKKRTLRHSLIGRGGLVDGEQQCGQEKGRSREEGKW
jgi:hypothetical protein